MVLAKPRELGQWNRIERIEADSCLFGSFRLTELALQPGWSGWERGPWGCGGNTYSILCSNIILIFDKMYGMLV